MSPSNINSFVGDLVQMAKAMETLPEVQAENERLAKALDETLQTVQSRELRIIDLNATIAELNNKVRSLEVERDDASFRVLEAEDTAQSALAWLQTASVDLAIAIQKLDPPKPEPVKEPEPVAQGQSEMDPTQANDQSPSAAGTTTTTTAATGEGSEPIFTSSGFQSSEPQASTTSTGQSVENPSAPNPDGDGNHTGDASTTIVEKQSDAAPSPITSPGPYSGKRYYDHVDYISYQDWINGGGTEIDYNWRPTPPIASGSY